MLDGIAAGYDGSSASQWKCAASACLKHRTVAALSSEANIRAAYRDIRHVIRGGATTIDRTFVSSNKSTARVGWGDPGGRDAGLNRIRSRCRLLPHILALAGAGWCGCEPTQIGGRSRKLYCRRGFLFWLFELSLLNRFAFAATRFRYRWIILSPEAPAIRLVVASTPASIFSRTIR